MAYSGPIAFPVIEGGTGDTSFTAYSVITGGTTSTGALQNVSGVGTSGQVLTSNGASALPTWQAAGGGSGITTIDGDSGSITGSTVTIYFNVSSGTPKFVNSGTISQLKFTDSNGNIILGFNVDGYSGGGSVNTGLGTNVFSNQIGIGNYNLGLGYTAGYSYTTTESNNILLLNQGVRGESNVIRIGTQGTGNFQQNTCYIAGIEGATYSAASPTPSLTYCDTSDGQLVAASAVASSSATSTFGSLVVGTARQNTSTYAILVNVSIVVTAATGATITLGIGSTSTPSVNTVVTTFSAAATTTFSFTGFVPAKYYMLVNTTGTITVGSITTQTCCIG